MLSLFNSQGMKSSKSRKLCLSIPFTQMIGPLFDMFISAMVIFFFCEIPKYMKVKNRLGHLDLDFMEVG